MAMPHSETTGLEYMASTAWAGQVMAMVSLSGSEKVFGLTLYTKVQMLS